jgi:3-deoxy-7-phosphoheptulonate synthase
MVSRTDDLRISNQKPLLSPAILADELPAEESVLGVVDQGRRAVESILSGADRRLLVVAGPCSVHDAKAALDYAQRLKVVADRLADDVLVTMRVYFEKPRTTVGWKGLINDPDLDGSFRINKGLRLARGLLLDVARVGLPVGTEFLDTILGQYFADLVSWGAIGARTTESQIHREMASGLSMPVGFKNRTDGDVRVAIDAIQSARAQHWFPSLTKEGAPAILCTRGNPFAHLVLRGGWPSGPNHTPEAVDAALRALEAAALPRVLMIDCSHANSRKDPARQPEVARVICDQISTGEKGIVAVMIESHLEGGRQDVIAGRPLRYGVSITDGCLAWEETVPVLENLAVAARARR